MVGKGGVNTKNLINKWPAQSFHLFLGRPKLKGKVIYDHKHSNRQDRGLQEPERGHDVLGRTNINKLNVAVRGDSEEQYGINHAL